MIKIIWCANKEGRKPNQTQVSAQVFSATLHHLLLAAAAAAVAELITREAEAAQLSRAPPLCFGKRSVEQLKQLKVFEPVAATRRALPASHLGGLLARKNSAALPSSARLIAEVRRVNIVHISEGWSADGRKLQKLSSGIEEAERSQREARESRWRRCRERQPLTRTRRRAKCHLIVTAEKAGLAFPLAPRNMISDEFTPPECFLSPVHPKCLPPPWVMAEFPSLPFKTQSFHCDICTSTAITNKDAFEENNTEDYCYFVLFLC